LLGLGPVHQELLQPDLGQRVVEQRLDSLGRAGADVGADAGGLDDMDRPADTGDQGRLRAEIQYAVKLLGKATDQVVILAKAKSDDEVAARELPTSPAENEENFYT